MKRESVLISMEKVLEERIIEQLKEIEEEYFNANHKYCKLNNDKNTNKESEEYKNAKEEEKILANKLCDCREFAEGILGKRIYIYYNRTIEIKDE